MSESPPTLIDQLSAYLDGELDASASRAIEERLATDPSARDELARLERAWQMLDGLPRSAAQPSFAATTVEMIAVNAAESAEAVRRQFRAGAWGLRAAAVVVALLGGYWLVASLAPHPNQSLLADLPVIEHLDLLRQVPDVAFARLLHERGLLAASDAAVAPLADPGDLSQRRDYVTALTPEQKQSLLEKNERFLRMPTSEQDRLRGLERELAAAPDRQELWTTISRYYAWLETLSAVQRAELSQLEPAARVERIKHLQNASQKRKMHLLSPPDLAVLTRWLEQRALAAMPPKRREEFQTMSPAERRRAVGRELWQRGTNLEPGKGPPLLSDQEIAELSAQLSSQAQQKLQRLEPFQQRMLLIDWIRQALGDRDELHRLPADELPSELKRRYLQRIPDGDKKLPIERREKPPPVE